MTFGDIGKRWLAAFPRHFFKALKDPPFKGSQSHPPIVILDYMRIIKFLRKPPKIPKKIETGLELFKYQVAPEIQRYFNCGAKKVIICFDRGSPSNKFSESQSRYKNREKFDLPEDPRVRIISDDILPSEEEWPSVIANKYASQEIIQYLTEKFIETSISVSKDNFHLKIDPGCSLIIHGGRIGRTQKYTPHDPVISGDPLIRSKLSETVKPKPRLIVITRDSEQTINDETKSLQFKIHVTVENQDAERLDRLLEGELSVMYFVRVFELDDILISTSDGDLLIMLLMNSLDRINPITATFRNQIFLDLKVHGKSDFVQINGLYTDILNVYRHTTDSCENVIMEICLLLTLEKNDFIRDFAKGLGKCEIKNDDFSTNGNLAIRSYFGILKNCEQNDINFKIKQANCHQPNTKITWILKTYLDNLDLYSGFLKSWSIQQISLPLFCRGSSQIPRGFEIDEELFIRLVERSYFEKYKNIKKSNLSSIFIRNPQKYSIDVVKEDELKAKIATRNYLKSYKNKKYRMMVPRVIRVHSRNLLWLQNYWYNGHRGNCQFPNPNATFRGLPYYGWTRNEDGNSIKSRIVSIGLTNNAGIPQKDFKKLKGYTFKPHKEFISRQKRIDNNNPLK